MDDTPIASRLKTFIDSQGLTHSQFADGCGIPRPSLSQLLTGRNKKINDVMVGQIHKVFPDLSIVWLLFGEGEMIKKPDKADSTQVKDIKDLFDNDELTKIDSENLSDSLKILGNGEEAKKNQKENGLKPDRNTGYISDIQARKYIEKIKDLNAKIENLSKNPRKAVQITVYYDDFTFETFFPNASVK